MDVEIKRGPGRPPKEQTVEASSIFGREVTFIQLHVAQQLRFGMQPKYSISKADGFTMFLNKPETLVFVDMGDRYTWFGLGNVLRGECPK